MSRLVKEACTLRFEEHEFVAFFGVSSPLDEEECSFSYQLERDGLRLLLTIFPVDGGVYLSLCRDGSTDSVVTSRLQACTHSRFVKWGGKSCLEIGRPERSTSGTGVALVWGLRLFVDPHFRIEFIHQTT